MFGWFRQPSVHAAAFGLLLQQGGAFAPVLCAMQGGALLLGFGVLAWAVMSGSAAAVIVAMMRAVVRIIRVVFCVFDSPQR